MPSIINATVTSGLTANSDVSGNLIFQTSSNNVLTLDNAQNATFAGSVSAPNTFGFKNRIINGDMRIDQRNAGNSVATSSGTGLYTTDRWNAIYAATSKYTVQQNAGSITPPTGFTNYLGVTSTSAYTAGASEYFSVRQMIEGYNVADLGWGTVNAQTATLSFWVRSSLTGTFGGAIVNGGNAGGENRSYPFSYIVSNANTWQQISLTVAGDTTGTWATTNTGGIQIRFGLGAGSTFLGTSGSWQAGNFIQPTGTVSVVGTNGATFYITGVQLEKGSQATPFDFRDYGRELIMCQRYCYVIVPNSISAVQNSFLAQGYFAGSGSAQIGVNFPVALRTVPTLSYAGALGNLYIFNVASQAYQVVSALSLNLVSSSQYCYLAITCAAGGTAGSGAIFICDTTKTAYPIFSAEL
jgi:hypothetical protein